MTTTIKVSDITKQRLDMIQAKITLVRRSKVTLMELIDIMTRIALRHEDELLGDQRPRHNEKEAEASADKRSRDGGDRTDEYVYEE
ncbi:MAG: hypothetical protein OIN66_09285 [Candidatus Methanoperedens sp.]|nr:hypothetical protein [Candidatus Methanoperedens sp.]